MCSLPMAMKISSLFIDVSWILLKLLGLKSSIKD